MAALQECLHVSYNFDKIFLLTILLFQFLKNNAICHYVVELILSFPGQCLIKVVGRCNKLHFSLVIYFLFMHEVCSVFTNLYIMVSHFYSALAGYLLF